MEANGCREGVEGVSEPCVELVRRGGEGGRRDAEVFDEVLQTVPVGFVPHGLGGGSCVRRCGEVYEDGDMV